MYCNSPGQLLLLLLQLLEKAANSRLILQLHQPVVRIKQCLAQQMISGEALCQLTVYGLSIVGVQEGQSLYFVSSSRGMSEMLMHLVSCTYTAAAVSTSAAQCSLLSLLAICKIVDSVALQPLLCWTGPCLLLELHRLTRRVST